MDNKKKITFVINYFYPDLAATSQLLTELTSNIQHDYDITVIAAQPGYAGEKNYGVKIFEEDFLEAIKVIRIKLPEVNKKSKISRIKYIVSYFILANTALLKEKRTDIIFTISQPPVLGGLIGSIGKFFKRSKHIYSIHDFNPEQAAAVKYTNNQFIFAVAKVIDKINCRYADHILLVGNDMVETLKERFKHKNVPAYTVISNWTNETEILPLDKDHEKVTGFLKENGIQDKFIVMYSGNLGLYYDLENIVKVFKNFDDVEDIVFLFIGEGAVKQQMQNYIEKEKLENVLFLPYQPKEFIRYSLNAADIHLVVNQKGIKGVSVPSKIYGVMAAGKSVLGVIERGSEIDRLISESGNGIVVEPQDYNEIISAIKQFYNMDRDTLKEMGMNGRQYLEKHLTKATSINKYREVFHSLAYSGEDLDENSIDSQQQIKQ
ncbi:glycosyltransferase family 4 protein [Metaplanococcus flavidus]|uniref:Glycosyltransferase family 4 protein n=1 Tax=Metaplanococcus flavidus TaxID=569883 RepID=A0ABW3LBL0_9BACL